MIFPPIANTGKRFMLSKKVQIAQQEMTQQVKIDKPVKQWNAIQALTNQRRNRIMATAILNVARLRELLDYNKDSGEFRWKIYRGGCAKVGDLAGATDSKGYRQIRVDGTLHLAHRLGWMYVHGSFPATHLDHADRNPQNNAIANLRICSHAQNHQNIGVRSDSSSGVTGVTMDKASSRWLAYINLNGRRHRLGLFACFEDAVNARISAKQSLHAFSPVQVTK